jgi:hypothetical protein
VVLYLVIRFAPVPGVPCEISASKECAPSNDTIAYVPNDAVLYAHLTVNSDSHQWELAQNLQDELPNFVALLQSDTSALATPAGRQVDLGHECCPGPRTTSPCSACRVPGDDARDLHRRRGGQRQGGPVPRDPLAGATGNQVKIGDATVTVYPTGLATTRSGDEALFGNVVAVRAALAAQSGSLPSWRAPTRAPRATSFPTSGSRISISPGRV